MAYLIQPRQSTSGVPYSMKAIDETCCTSETRQTFSVMLPNLAGRDERTQRDLFISLFKEISDGLKYILNISL
jgi:hypothetical protein